MYNYIICIYITLETSGGLLSILWLLSCEGCLFYNSSWISPPAACPASWMKEETKPQHLYRHQALFASLYLASALLSREEPFWMHWIYFISTLKWVCRGVLYPVDTHQKNSPNYSFYLKAVEIHFDPCPSVNSCMQVEAKGFCLEACQNMMMGTWKKSKVCLKKLSI